MRHRTVHSTLIQSPFGLQRGQKYQDSTIQVSNPARQVTCVRLLMDRFQIKRGCKDETVVTIEGKGENVGNAVCVIRPREHPRFTRGLSKACAVRDVRSVMGAEDNDLISEQILPISRFFTKGVYKLRIKTMYVDVIDLIGLTFRQFTSCCNLCL